MVKGRQSGIAVVFVRVKSPLVFREARDGFCSQHPANKAALTTSYVPL